MKYGQPCHWKPSLITMNSFFLLCSSYSHCLYVHTTCADTETIITDLVSEIRCYKTQIWWSDASAHSSRLSAQAKSTFHNYNQQVCRLLFRDLTNCFTVLQPTAHQNTAPWAFAFRKLQGSIISNFRHAHLWLPGKTLNTHKQKMHPCRHFTVCVRQLPNTPTYH